MNRAVVVLVLIASLSVSLHAAQVRVILLSNSIDYDLAQDFVAFLGDKGVETLRVEAADFQQYQGEAFIIILGGPDAPEGVGEVVQQVLSREEQDYLRTHGNKAMYVKSNMWAQGQRVFVLAGSDRNQTREAHIEHRGGLYQNISAPQEFKLTPPEPLPSGSLVVYAGEYTGSIFYWGYEKTGEYTTVRLQKEYVEPTTTTTTRKNVTVHEDTAEGGNTSTITLDTSASKVDDYYNDMWIEITGGTGSGQVRKITDYGTQHQGTAQGGTASTITLATSASSVHGAYNGMWIEITGGTGSGQVRKITDYNGDTKVATVDTNWDAGEEPDTTSTYRIHWVAEVDTAWDTIPDTTSTYRILDTIKTTYVTEVRPQKFEHRTVYVTFKDSELPVKFQLEGVEYEILYYDNEKIIIKKL
jgi:hypothetical protein